MTIDEYLEPGGEPTIGKLTQLMDESNYTKYIEIYDKSVREYMATMFNDQYRNGWILTDMVRMPDGDWLLKWGKDLTKGVTDVQTEV